MLKNLMTNPYAWAALAVITITSLVYAIICQHRNKEKKELSYRQITNSLIVKKKSKYEKLSIFYDKQQIEDLSVCRFIIWNSGNKTLNSLDMVDSKELTISALGDHIILDAELIAQTEETNEFQIKIIDEHTVKIYFDYADKKDGIVLQIIHTGTKNDLKLDCKIKGGNPLKNTAPKKYAIKNRRREAFSGVMVVFLALATLYMFLLTVLSTFAIFNLSVQNFMHKMNDLLSEQQYAILLSITGWIYSLLMGRLIINNIKNIFCFGIPKTLKKYVDLE